MLCKTSYAVHVSTVVKVRPNSKGKLKFYPPTDHLGFPKLFINNILLVYKNMRQRLKSLINIQLFLDQFTSKFSNSNKKWHVQCIDNRVNKICNGVFTNTKCCKYADTKHNHY